MAALPGNAELRHQVVSSGKNFTIAPGNEEFEFYLYRVAVDSKSLPRTQDGSEFIFSGSANDKMVGPLLEKSLIDLHFDGNYWLFHAVFALTVLTSFTDGYFEEL